MQAHVYAHIASGLEYWWFVVGFIVYSIFVFQFLLLTVIILFQMA
jgi:hypothetical protein